MSDLSKIESGEFAKLCTVVHRGLSGFIEVGLALSELNLKRLYRDEYETFEAFVQDKFKLSRRRAYQMIDEAQIASTTDGITNGAQARALKDVPISERTSVIEACVSEGKLTAAGIKATAVAMKQHDTGQHELEGWKIVAIADRAAEIGSQIKAVGEEPVGKWLPVDRILSMVARLHTTINESVPDQECPKCKGVGCKECFGCGYIPTRLDLK